jgi:hypothetical protein
VNTLFLVAMIVEGIFAVGFIFVPDLVLAPNGVTLDATSRPFVRLFGSALLTFPVLLSYARASADLALKRVAARTLFVYMLVSTVLIVIAQLGGLMNASGWVIVAIHVVFTIWSGAYLGK